MEAAAAAEPACSSPSTAAAAPRPPKQRPQRRRGGPAEEQVRVQRRTLEAVLEQCQRTLEMLKNADLEPDPDAGDEIGSKGSAGEEEEEEEEEEEVQSRTPSSVNYETDELREYVDDTEDYINIMLDDKQNQLLQMGVMLTTTTVVATAAIVVTSLFGMNIHIELMKDPVTEQQNLASNINFWETTLGSAFGCLVLYILAVILGKRSRLLQ